MGDEHTSHVWESLSPTLDISELVPEEYAAYRPVVTDALFLFLEHLPAERSAAIIADQMSLPADTGVRQRLIHLMHQCPTLHKLGQVVARHQKLDLELRERLQGLESMPPVTPFEEVLPIIARQLPDLPASGVKLGESALAEASVAVVVPFTWQDPDALAPSQGVLKVLKPGIQDRLGEELAIWPRLGSFLDERCHAYGLPELDYRETLENVRTLLENEVHLDREQRHIAEATRCYKDAFDVRVPGLLPFCTPQITAMERINGRPVMVHDGESAADRRRLAESILRALLARPIWDDDNASLFHADPHAGNLFVTEQRQLAILDWSLVGRLLKSDRIQLVQVMLAALTFDSGRLAKAVSGLGISPPREEPLRTVVAEALRRIRGGMIPGLRWLMLLLDDAARTTGLRFPGDLLMFRKAVFTLDGVIADLSPETSIDAVLHVSALEQFSREWTSRLFAYPHSRQFGTHVSNVDLLEFVWALPGANLRFLIDTWRDCLDNLAHLPGYKQRN